MHALVRWVLRSRLRLALAAAVGTLVLAGGGGAAVCWLTPVRCDPRDPEPANPWGLPDGFVQDVVARRLVEPSSLTLLPDGRIVVAHREGLISVVENGQVLETPLLDLRALVNSEEVRGLLAVEASPDVERTGHVYVMYVHEDGSGPPSEPRTVRVSRFTAQGNTASLTSEVVVLGREGHGGCESLPVAADCIPSEGDHSGGGLEFGDDGSLLVSTGDGWSGLVPPHPIELRAQDLDSLGGKVLRVTPDGKSLPTNPYWTGDPADNRTKVFAYGLRNPFSLALRPGTGSLVAGDAGYGSFEELDLIVRAANFGWPCYEGPLRQRVFEDLAACRTLYKEGDPAPTFPLIAYAYPDEARVIISGAFLAGSSLPEEYRGALLHADFDLGVLRTLQLDGDGRLIAGSEKDFTSVAIGQPVAIEAAWDGTIYYLSYYDRQLRRIRYLGG